MNASDVLRQARDSFMEILVSGGGGKMHLADYVLHVLRAAKGDTALANEALAYLPSHQERFDRGIARAEGRDGAGTGTTIVCNKHDVQLLAYRGTSASPKSGCAVCLSVGPTGGDKDYED